MPVQGIGGLFFRARDPEGLADWYRRHLGIGAGCAAEGTGTPDEWFWKPEGGPVVLAPFKADSDYFAADKQWMLNLRVTDLEGLLEQLNARGIAIEKRAEWDSAEHGNFARITETKGHAIELWRTEEGGAGQKRD